MKLEYEIRKVLWAANKPLHPRNIRCMVLADRKDRSLPEQKLETFNRVMRSMPDVETIEIDGKFYRRLIKQKTNTKIDTVFLTRVTEWLKLSRLIAVLSNYLTKHLIGDLKKKLNNLRL